ncbi:hypothetical protein PNOK_0933500 [Pyrrhoderma noxium]|uniref:F-box domain-containing protein n=1 Tax=Pyrrhoderma noxium TaxID=2282107 RepID=A0A286U5G4_9AGAM|nr:hypothetical protein PNOK_0933500 [Pyrrhoderma noxium]
MDLICEVWRSQPRDTWCTITGGYTPSSKEQTHRNRGNHRNHLRVEMGSIKLDTMPEDILTHILLYGITDDFETNNYEYRKLFLLMISHTNQALRRFALSTPYLWSTLYIDTCRNKPARGDDGLLNLFRLWIERSGDSPLNYKITSYTTSADVLELFFREKRRWKSVKLEFGDHVPHLSFEPTDMPYLQNFELVSLRDYVPIEKIIHLSKSTQLGRLYLNQVDSAQWRTIMETIHTQQLTELYLGLTDRGLAVADPYLLKSLGMFTNLKRLKFDLYHMSKFNFDPVWSGPPVLLPNLTMLVLAAGCGKLTQYLTTPSLISLSIIPLKDEGSWIVNYFRRSHPPLEIMHLEIYYLEMGDLRFILQEVPNLKTFSLIHGKRYNESKGPYNIWSLLRVDDPSLDILVPKLTDLLYDLPERWERNTNEEVLLLVDAVESRKRYIRNFHFHILYWCYNFSRHVRNMLVLVDEPDAFRTHEHLEEVFRFSG